MNNILDDDPRSAKDKPITPFTFKEKGHVNSPISYLNQNINGEEKFAIVQTTDGGKWIRGNLLFYKFKGIEIYTDRNNIIFVDTINDVLFIREYEKVQKEINPPNPEDIQYIILYTDLGYEDGMDDQEFPLRWTYAKGRLTAYDSIKANAPIVDVDKSIILSETVSVKDALSIREFIKYIQNAGFVDPEEFNIDDYGDSRYM